MDPRAEEDIDCKTKVSNNTFDCGTCENNGHVTLEEGQTYTLGADLRCTYKVDFHNKTNTEK